MNSRFIIIESLIVTMIELKSLEVQRSIDIRMICIDISKLGSLNKSSIMFINTLHHSV